jgi:cell division protein FtsQ
MNEQLNIFDEPVKEQPVAASKDGKAKAAREMSVLRISYLVTAIVILGLSLAVGFHVSRDSTVDNVHVIGNYFTTGEQILKAAHIPAGIHTDSLDVIGVLDRIEKLPWIAEAGLSVSPFGRLDISVTERRAIALIMQGDASVYVDSDGVRLPVIDEKPVDVPLLYGFRAGPLTDTLKSDSFLKVAEFLLAAEKNPAAHRTLSEIAWAGYDGIVALSHDNGIKLIFGNEHFEERLRNWTSFYSIVIPEKGIGRFQSIDFRYRDQIITHES